VEELGLLIDFRLLILQAVGFLAIYLVLRRYLFGPIGAILRARETEVAENLSHAENEMEAASRLRSDLEANLASIHQEARRQVGQAMAEAAEEREKMLAETRVQCEKLLNRAREEIEREQRRALAELRGQVADLALLATSRALQVYPDDYVHDRVIEGFIDRLEAIS
jgi:F-type H+-transporting ATPase subunit b